MTGQSVLPVAIRLEADIDGPVPHLGSPMTGLGHDMVDPQREAAVNVAQMGTDSISPGHNDSLDKASRMQLRWVEAKCKNMDLPDGYQTVAVLIIKWCKELDELNCAAEVEELDGLFTNEFKYETEIVELNDKQKPQLQLNHAISGFAMQHNSRNNLMIVYYTGHSKFHESTGVLEFYASNDRKLSHARANWNTAETSLMHDVESDVLTILDTCFASNLQKNIAPPGRCYELLAASHFNKPTSAPGPKSFTRALINSLRQLLEETKEHGFTTWNLVAQIAKQPERQNNPPYIIDRLRRWDRRIRLAPLDTNPVKRRRPSTGTQSNCYLTLEFALNLANEELNEKQIEDLTVFLPQAFKNAQITLRDMNWLELRTPTLHTDFSRVVLLYSNVYNCVDKWRRKTKKVETTRPVKRRRSESSLESPDTSPKRTISQVTRNEENRLNLKMPSPVSAASPQYSPHMEDFNCSHQSDMDVE